MKTKRISSISVMFYFFKIAFKTRPSYPFLIFFSIVVNAIQPFVTIIFPTLIIEELNKFVFEQNNTMLETIMNAI